MSCNRIRSRQHQREDSEESEEPAINMNGHYYAENLPAVDKVAKVDAQLSSIPSIVSNFNQNSITSKGVHPTSDIAQVRLLAEGVH